MAVLSARPRRPSSLFSTATHAEQQRRDGRTIPQELRQSALLFSSAKHGRSPTSTKETLYRDHPWLDSKPNQHHHQRAEQAQVSCPRFCRQEDGDNHAELLLRTMCETGQLDRALHALSRIHKPPSITTYLSLLKACGKTKSLAHAKQVHAHLALHRAHLTGFLGDYLVMTLARCGAIDDARLLSATLPCLTVFSWTALISAYAESGCGREALEMYQRMQEGSQEPDSFTFLSLFKACGTISDLGQGKKLHAHARSKGFASNAFVGTAIVSMYAKCGALTEAEEAFDELSCRNTVSWNGMLSAFVEQGQGQKTLQLYRQMQEDCVEPDSFTFVSLFKACGSIPDLAQGKKLHAHAASIGFLSNPFVGNTIVSMYRKCGALREAEVAFGALYHRDIVSWNGMLSAYVEQGQGDKALQLYRQMQEESMSPDHATFVIALQACGTLTEKEDALDASRKSTKEVWLEIGRALHADARREKFDLNVLVGTAILSVYGKCGIFREAEYVFSTLVDLDTVAWNAMLSAYVEQGQGEAALLLYVQMQKQGAAPNHITFVTALQACCIHGEKEETFVTGRSSKANYLEIGQALHAEIHRKGYSIDAPIANTLVSMYGKCGTIVEAEDVFNTLSQVDTISWNAMLSACVEQRQGEKALSFYRKMQEEHVTQDDVTHICVLQACSEAGSLELCKELHFNIVSTGHDRISPVAATLINAYGSCASMVDAQEIFDGILESNVVSWNACIAGYAGEGNTLASLHMFEDMKQAGSKPNEVTFTSVLSVCSHTALVVEGLEYFESMTINYGITSERTHYKIMIDLLGRAEDFKRIENMLGSVPMQSDLAIWLCVLGVCSICGNLELGKQAFDQAVHLQSKRADAYVMMSNVYADDVGPPYYVVEV